MYKVFAVGMEEEIRMGQGVEMKPLPRTNGENMYEGFTMGKRQPG